MDTGYYEKSKLIQEETLSKSFAKCVALLDTVLKCDVNTSQPWCIADLGCADGMNTLPLFYMCVKRLREADQARPIILIFDDQPCNDFSRITAMDPQEFGENVYMLVSTRSFFDVTVPPDSVHLSFSSHAMHYLAGPPPINFEKTGLKDTDATPEDRAIFAAQAAKDWEKLLLSRASELTEGGVTVLSLLVKLDNGDYYGFMKRPGVNSKSLYTELSDCMRQLMKDGRLTNREFRWATSPEYFRSLDELRAPFEDQNGPVANCGLKLLGIHVQISECALRKKLMSGEYEGKQKEYGDMFSECIAAHARSKLMRAFEHPGNMRSEDEKKELIDEVFRLFARRVEANPQSFGVDNVCAVLTAQRQKAASAPQTA